eukprot:218255_1
MSDPKLPPYTRVLWDPTPCGPPIHITPSTFIPPIIRISVQVLHDLIVHLESRRLPTKTPLGAPNYSYSACLVGRWQLEGCTPERSPNLCLVVDRYCALQNFNSPTFEETDESFVIPVVSSTKQNDDGFSESDYTAFFREFFTQCGSRDTPHPNRFTHARAHLAPSNSGTVADGCWRVFGELLTPSLEMSFTPLNPLRIVDSHLSKSIQSSKADLSPKTGYLMLNQFRNAILLIDSDPHTYTSSLSGIWVSDVTNPRDRFVWSSCLRFLFNDSIERVTNAPRTFLVLLVGVDCMPRFFECAAEASELPLSHFGFGTDVLLADREGFVSVRCEEKTRPVEAERAAMNVRYSSQQDILRPNPECTSFAPTQTPIRSADYSIPPRKLSFSLDVSNQHVSDRQTILSKSQSWVPNKTNADSELILSQSLSHTSTNARSYPPLSQSWPIPHVAPDAPQSIFDLTSSSDHLMEVSALRNQVASLEKRLEEHIASVTPGRNSGDTLKNRSLANCSLNHSLLKDTPDDNTNKHQYYPLDQSVTVRQVSTGTNTSFFTQQCETPKTDTPKNNARELSTPKRINTSGNASYSSDDSTPQTPQYIRHMQNQVSPTFNTYTSSDSLRTTGERTHYERTLTGRSLNGRISDGHSYDGIRISKSSEDRRMSDFLNTDSSGDQIPKSFRLSQHSNPESYDELIGSSRSKDQFSSPSHQLTDAITHMSTPLVHTRRPILDTLSETECRKSESAPNTRDFQPISTSASMPPSEISSPECPLRLPTVTPDTSMVVKFSNVADSNLSFQIPRIEFPSDVINESDISFISKTNQSYPKIFEEARTPPQKSGQTLDFRINPDEPNYDKNIGHGNKSTHTAEVTNMDNILGSLHVMNLNVQ